MRDTTKIWVCIAIWIIFFAVITGGILSHHGK